MHYLLRTLLNLVMSRRRSPLSLWDTSVVRFRTLPMDVDIAVHMNNGVYFTMFDLGRFDLLVRAGAFEKTRSNGWTPVVAAETISFRKSLNLGKAYELHTRILGSDERAVYFEQRMVADGEIYARGYVCTRMTSANGPVPVEDLLALAEPAEEGRNAVPEWLLEWREKTALPSTRRPAPNVWDAPGERVGR
ncbi:acyl-CoA thioesterase [Falsarthrobacter nasiphocae]|uniref:Acyl-CoA thioesterase FadM n=1 Tax=Falsarthrobacter nasiphocae TaxID=189863 RepID=A0AAE3YE73_9MICC|nr:acyl-CoA thioesterase [Falsarthrobacter nasiphocae]MDR6891749.1 acyl-CoA thioesterase FadM [Falsarthrobacter nasiphocae]